MKNSFTPRQVASALDVSESSVKRWCDRGAIPTQYTAGGHRRIAISGLCEFLRQNRREIARPEVLGLPAATGKTQWVIDRAVSQFSEALLAGDEDRCRALALDLYLAEHSLSSICDRVIAVAFQEIGDLWHSGDIEVFQERRGCEITRRVLHELRALLPSPPENAPRAVGGSTEGDQYNLATTMAELVLRDAKWNAVSLGDNLPFKTLAAAIRETRPRMFWLSCSHISQVEEFLAGYNALYEEFGLDVAFVVGGRVLDDPLRQNMRYAAYCDNMQHLEGTAHSLWPVTTAGKSGP